MKVQPGHIPVISLPYSFVVTNKGTFLFLKPFLLEILVRGSDLIVMGMFVMESGVSIDNPETRYDPVLC